MNWFRENKFLSGFIAVVVLAAGALLFLVLGAKSAHEAAMQDYEGKVQTLISQRAWVPFRDAANLKKLKDQESAYDALTTSLQADLVAKQPQISTMEPSAFQGRLREAVSAVTTLAQTNGVTLPEKFYLGFERYQTELPRNEVTGLLDWQLTAIQGIITRMIELKVSSIDNVVRPPLPGEAAPEPAPKEPPLLVKYPLQIGCKAAQERVQALINDLSTNNRFMIIRAVKIQNETLTGPPRIAAAAPSDTPVAEPFTNAAGIDASKAAPASKEIIAGNEKISVQIILDLVQFVSPSSTEKANPNGVSK